MTRIGATEEGLGAPTDLISAPEARFLSTPDTTAVGAPHRGCGEKGEGPEKSTDLRRATIGASVRTRSTLIGSPGVTLRSDQFSRPSDLSPAGEPFFPGTEFHPVAGGNRRVNEVALALYRLRSLPQALPPASNSAAALPGEPALSMVRPDRP
jgi:hypothetical protein